MFSVYFFLLNGATCEPKELSSRVECWLWICLCRRMVAARPSRYCCRSGDMFWKPAFEGSWGNRGPPLSEFMWLGENLLLKLGRPGKGPWTFGLGKAPKDQCGRSTMRHSMRQVMVQRSSLRIGNEQICKAFENHESHTRIAAKMDGFIVCLRWAIFSVAMMCIGDFCTTTTVCLTTSTWQQFLNSPHLPSTTVFYKGERKLLSSPDHQVYRSPSLARTEQHWKNLVWRQISAERVQIVLKWYRKHLFLSF